MNIVLVIDQFDHGNNGTTITARRYAEQLRKRGHRVTILAAGEPEENKICVPKHTIPIFESLIESQGMYFAKPVEEAYYQAFRDADIVHFYMPFRFCRKGESLARQMGIPTLAAFHVQPENITSSIHLGKQRHTNEFLYHWFRQCFYDRFHLIHCPSQFIADQLKAHGYQAQCRVISNGVDDAFVPPEKPVERKDDTFRILMIGRLSVEKRQDLIIRAAGLSRHADRIQLIFAGKGPMKKAYQGLARKLPRKPVFGFYSKEELVELIQSCDLYVHASDAEIEGISCMEAFSCGLVPVISNSPLSATHQFALDERCLFQAGDPHSLAERMDYWFEHPEEKAALSLRYVEQGNSMRVENCVAQAEQLYLDAIAAHKKLGYAHPTESRFRRCLHPDASAITRRYGRGTGAGPWLRAGFTNLLSPLLWLLDWLGWGYSVEGRENLRGLQTGAVTVMNHVHPMDCTMVKLATFPRRLTMLSLKQNLELPLVGWLTYACGALPLPDSLRGMADLEPRLEAGLHRGELLHFYAEGFLITGHEGLRPFHRGAFVTAVRGGCPVVPMALVQVPARGLRRLWCKPYFLRVKIGTPLMPDPALSRREAAEDLRRRTEQAIRSMLEGEERPQLAEHECLK